MTTRTGVLIQPDGKIVVGGWTGNPGSSNDGSGFTAPTLALTRYQSSGALDSTFGAGGVAVTQVAVNPPIQQGFSFQGMALQADGKILLPYNAPTTTNSFGLGNDFGLARFLDVNLDASGPSTGVTEQPLRFTGTFDGQSTDDTSQVTWVFGDGAVLKYRSAKDPGALNVAHTYEKDGIYTVSLTIRWTGGETLTTAHQVTVFEEDDQLDRYVPSHEAEVGDLRIQADVAGLLGSRSVIKKKLRISDALTVILAPGQRI